ncbi:type II toxin-antitoxin system VapC family toxin [Aldersonia sp. NBC_00410]|uniref:type II toxin-antitoxin system VapC family toxin n=1 Tax=Aldersonia sp. NBC_00410 TaxID=2975954 RepID=UPI0022567DDB|nr:type II toxin-antitoxin system VapC family toxin [Aldersonia sp. NBC_00410]MCX5041967.1 type II toxin-antitoxin system VapC family toxin [Aldersonia sp. NBC_00410]
MLLPDVNVLVYAFRTESPRHGEYRSWLTDLVNGPAAFALSELVVSGFVRIVTNSRIFRTPTPPAMALEFADLLLTRPNCVVVRPGPRHFAVFAELCRTVDARGNDVADAYHAALAIESGSEFVTTDRGFARFPGLRWCDPLAD